MFRLLILLAFTSNVALAAEQVIKTKEPNGFSDLSQEIADFSDTKQYKGHHGLKEYCYSNNGFITYSQNLLGHGYNLSTQNPENRECADRDIIASNKFGIYLNMPKQKIEELLQLKLESEKSIIIWHSPVYYSGVEYTRQVYATFTFTNDKLSTLDVFTTETN
jgi:hypothetical protein